ncbi:MAG: ABC transporter permease [Gemmatimonadales bacterium]
MDTLFQDLRHAARSLTRSPGFALTAVLTLALGIGASTAIFSVVRAVLLKPLPYAQPQRLTIVWGELRKRNVTNFPLSPADFSDMRRAVPLFEGLAGVVTFRQPVSGNDVPPEQVFAAAATTNVFRVLGLKVPIGRDFTDEDGTPQQPPPPNAAPPVPGAPAPPRLPAIAILSHEFFQRRFGGDRSIVGKSFTIGNQQAQVVGVLEPGAELLFPPSANVERHPAFWIALRQNFADTSKGARINVFLRVVGRLKPGVTLGQAQAQLDALASQFREQFAISKTADQHFRAEPMADNLVADVRSPVLALMGAVVFVLLIACANVSNLLLVRSAGRGHELAVRAALGGSRARLVRQLLAESLVLAGAGAVLGVALARLGIQLLLAIGPESLPRLDTVGIDPLVLGFAIVATVAAAAAFGVVPALRASQAEAADALRSGTRSVGRRGRLSSGVVIAEVALSFVLLVGSGLMMRSFIALQRTDAGFDASHVLTFFTSNFRVNGRDALAVKLREISERVAQLPGVRRVSAAGPFPLDGRIQNGRYGTSAAETDPALFQQADVSVVRPGFFETIGTPLIEGRTFTEADNRDSAMLVVIDQLLAKKLFPGRSAVGQRLLARVRTPEAQYYDVIGVVGHVRHAGLTTEGKEQMFFTDAYFGTGAADRWAVLTSGDPSRLIPAVREALRALDPELVVTEMLPMEDYVGKAQGQTRFGLILIGVFAVIAVVLAAVGLYGVLATLVRQRTSEIGVRLAFGAEPVGILKLVVGQGLRLSAAGLVLGLVAALALTRVMTHMLVDVTPTDPVTFVSIAALFLVIVTFASWIPARRAARVDPMVALRSE